MRERSHALQRSIAFGRSDDSHFVTCLDCGIAIRSCDGVHEAVGPDIRVTVDDRNVLAHE